MKKIMISLIGLLILSIVIYSCNKEEETCSTCTTAGLYNHKGIIYGDTFDFINHQSVDGFAKSNLVESKIPNDKFEKLKLKLDLNKYFTQKDVVVKKIIIYVTEPISKEFNFKEETISGFLIYYTKNNKLNTLVLKKTGSNVQIDNNFSTSVSDIIMTDIHYIGHNILSSSTSSAIFIHNKNDLISSTNFNLNLFTYKIQALNLINNSFKNLKAMIGGGKKCYTAYNGCPPGEFGGCTEKNGEWKCTGGCFIKIVIGNIGTLHQSGIISNLNCSITETYDVLKSFETNFLVKSEKGVLTQAKYYYISDVLIDQVGTDINADNLTYIYNTMCDVAIPIVQRLMNNPNSTEILYGDAERDNLIALCNFVKNLITDTTAKDILNEIITELNNYSNKTISEVNHYFNP